MEYLGKRACKKHLWSMSRKGECQDNAVAESFFHSLNVEWIYGEPLKSRYQIKRGVREYIEVFYNRQRLHSKNGYLSPVILRGSTSPAFRCPLRLVGIKNHDP